MLIVPRMENGLPFVDAVVDCPYGSVSMISCLILSALVSESLSSKRKDVH